MKRRHWTRASWLTVPAWAALQSGCGNGGQTYDDGADGLDGRRRAPDTFSSEPAASTEQNTELAAPSSGPFFDEECGSGECSSTTKPLPQCRDIYAEAYAAVDRMYSSVDRSCSIDEDCMLMPLRAVTCTPIYGGDCEAVVPMHIGALSFVSATLDDIQQRFCAEYEEGSCQLPSINPILCLEQVFTPRCADTECVVEARASDAGGPRQE